ncbi:MAG TPA: malic enzyme-like NAD(P)-binding protein, partial [Dehalococcoidia bacterium]
MQEKDYKIVRTLRCKNANIPGTLGKLATAIGSVGVEIGNITTVHLGHHFTVRDVEVFLDNEEQLTYLLDKISRLKETTVLEVRDDVLELHKGGKIKMMSTFPINSLEHLRKVYTPGVAEVCKLIRTQPSSKNIYTTILYSVAIVTDGTRILGLGDVGPIAGMPVMEGKAALLQQLVGISGIPILLNTTDANRIVETIKNIASTFGGIQLEDVESPKCFLIEDRLESELNIPVMHDDQQGTATVVLATLVNACKLTNVALQEARIGLVGLGAAGLRIGEFLLKYTGNPTLGTARTKDSVKRHVEQGGVPSSFDEIMRAADIVIATSTVGGLIKP